MKGLLLQRYAPHADIHRIISKYLERTGNLIGG
jgi:hypothetical protein